MFNRKKSDKSPKVMGNIALLDHMTDTEFPLFDAVVTPKAKRVTGFRFQEVEVLLYHPTETVAFGYRLLSFFADVARLMEERHHLGGATAIPVIEAHLKANYGAYSMYEDFDPRKEALAIVDSYVGSFQSDEEFIDSMLTEQVNSIRGIPTNAHEALVKSVDRDAFATWLMFQHYSEDNHYFKGTK